jgi:predicted dinucleotide-binding enzyme
MQPKDIKSVGIIGAGRIGKAIAHVAGRAGSPVVISNSRGPASLISPNQRLRPKRLGRAHVQRGRRRSRGPARVVKIANTLGAGLLASDPHEANGQRVLFLSGDDADAKAPVRGLFEDAGFSVVDLGGLREGGRLQQFGGPLAGLNLIRLA